jgi:hypothetical protein
MASSDQPAEVVAETSEEMVLCIVCEREVPKSDATVAKKPSGGLQRCSAAGIATVLGRISGES